MRSPPIQPMHRTACLRACAHQRAARSCGGFLFAALLAFFPAPVASQRHATVVQVVRVIDGDTIEVCCIGWKRESVRYTGVDTPETDHPTKAVEAYGKEAKEANRKLVAGKTVRLEFDVDPRRFPFSGSS